MCIHGGKRLRSQYPVLNIEKIEELSNITLDNSKSTAAQDKIYYRRKRVNQLRLRGYTNKQIAGQIGCDLSTVEKDLHVTRELSRQWYEEDSITEYCQSLNDSIVLYDNTIEDLRILYQNEADSELKLRILAKITEFEGKKTQLYEKTRAVSKFIQAGVSLC